MNLLRDMREVLKGLKRRNPSKSYCPRCGSSEIGLSTSTDYWLTPRRYFCKACGYSGPIVMEIEKEEAHT